MIKSTKKLYVSILIKNGNKVYNGVSSNFHKNLKNLSVCNIEVKKLTKIGSVMFNLFLNSLLVLIVVFC